MNAATKFIIINQDNKAVAFDDWEAFSDYLVERQDTSELYGCTAINLAIPPCFSLHAAQEWADELVEQDCQQAEHVRDERRALEAVPA